MRLPFIASALVLAVLVAVAVPAAALEKRKYDDAAFKVAQSGGKSILVDISATWCPVCKAQHKVLDSLAKRPEFADIVVFEVDFDTQKDAVKAFNARQQSTLIAFKGAREIKRVVGETATESIEGLLKTTLKK
ncbi:MAG: thioredoxin family protein [Sphingomonadales bacterium]|nr:thioredoxin family protein [Sphingomonadales bacterium]